MEGYQRIQEKLDIKILILFILRRLPGTVEPETLCDLAWAAITWAILSMPSVWRSWWTAGM